SQPLVDLAEVVVSDSQVAQCLSVRCVEVSQAERGPIAALVMLVRLLCLPERQRDVSQLEGSPGHAMVELWRRLCVAVDPPEPLLGLDKELLPDLLHVRSVLQFFLDLEHDVLQSLERV